MISRVFTPLDSAETREQAEAAIELFQIARYRNARAATLPQGTRSPGHRDGGRRPCRRAALDEPTSGISVEEKFGLMDVVMSALKSRKITVLFVEHEAWRSSGALPIACWRSTTAP